MPHISTLPLTGLFAERLRESAEEVAHAWLHRLVGRVNSSDQPTLPIKHLLEVAPAAVRWIASYIGDPQIEPRSVSPLFREIAELQRSRGRPTGEVIRDYEPLTDVLFDTLEALARESPAEASTEALTELGRRIHSGLTALSVVVIDVYEKENRKERRDAQSRLEDFVRTLSHEMKNPLGAAELALAMLNDEEMVRSAEERGRYVQMIDRNLKRALKLLDELRDRALPVRGASDSTGWSSLRALVSEVVNEVGPAAGESGVDIGVDELSEEMEVPSRAGKLVLMNLVWNAVKYSDADKDNRWIRIGVRQPDGQNACFIDVEDNGIGVPDNLRQRVFERFFRAHPDQANGSGLGLAIAREAAEEAGGGLWFRSEVGVGSTFTAALPWREKQGADTDGASSSVATTEPSGGPGSRLDRRSPAESAT